MLANISQNILDENVAEFLNVQVGKFQIRNGRISKESVEKTHEEAYSNMQCCIQHF